MKYTTLFVLLFLLSTKSIAQQEVSDNAFSGNKNKPEREEWLRDLGFGIFLHMNIDSQLGMVISHSVVGASEDYLNQYFTELPKTLILTNLMVTG